MLVKGAPGEACIDFFLQIPVKSDQQFACNCVEMTRSIRDQEKTGIQWSMTESYWVWGRPLLILIINHKHGNCHSVELDQKLIRPVGIIMDVSTKFEIDSLGAFSGNAQKLPNPSETWERCGSSGSWPKFNSAEGGPLRICLPNLS